MVRKAAITAIMLLCIAFGQSASGNGGIRSPFAVGLGARQLGMGGATVAYCSNSSSIYWNPAGLAFLNRPELELFYMNLFMDTRYECLTFAYPTLSAGVFGAGVGDLSSGEFIGRKDNHPDGTFSTRQDLFLVGYGFSPLSSLATGITIKGIYYDLADYKDTGFGFDLGTIYSAGFINGLSVGLKVSNVYSPRIKLHSLEQQYPLLVRSGLAFKKTFSGKHSLILSADVENTENAGTDIYAGGEFGFKDMVFARLGYMRDKITLGGGISLYNIRIDYAYASLAELDISHRFSLSYSFGTPVDIKRAQRDEIRAQKRFDALKQQEQQNLLNRIEQELDLARQFEEDGEIYKSVEAYYKTLGMDDQNEVARKKVVDLFEQIKLDVARQANRGYINNLTDRQLEIGNGYFDKKQYDKAAEQYRLALILAPDNQQAKDNLMAIEKIENNRVRELKTQADQLILDGDYEQALSKLDIVLQTKPDDRNAMAKKDEIYKKFKASDYLDKALKYFDKAEYAQAGIMVDSTLVLNPQSEGARSLKRQMARFTADVTTLEDINKNNTHWQIYIQGMEKYQSSEYNEALKLWRSLLEYYPNNPNLNRNIEQAVERSVKK